MIYKAPSPALLSLTWLPPTLARGGFASAVLAPGHLSTTGPLHGFPSAWNVLTSGIGMVHPLPSVKTLFMLPAW